MYGTISDRRLTCHIEELVSYKIICKERERERERV
jgi:hypothetical protein